VLWLPPATTGKLNMQRGLPFPRTLTGRDSSPREIILPTPAWEVFSRAR